MTTQLDTTLGTFDQLSRQQLAICAEELHEISRAFGEMKLVKRKCQLDRLTPHHRNIFHFIDRNPEIKAELLWQEYQIECEKE